MNKRTETCTILALIMLLLLVAFGMPTWADTVTQNVTVERNTSIVDFREFGGDWTEIAMWNFTGQSGSYDNEPTCYDSGDAQIYAGGTQDASSGVNEVTLNNSGTVAMDVYFYGTDITSATTSTDIDLSTQETYNCTAGIHGSAVSPISTAMVESSPGSPQISSLAPGGNQSLFLYLDIPQSTESASDYTGSFYTECSAA
ncbi:MAG: hypothetical protein SVK08_05985 [Halobacteriota archaeon]|nr:hypothetical protein [Halobacteriota archaeon]